MKKLMFILYSISVISLFIVYGTIGVKADSYVPAFAKVGGITIVANGEPYPYTFDAMTSPSQHYVDVSIEVTYDLIDGSFEEYPYVYVYFKSTAEDISVSRISTCSSSCFSTTLMAQPLGKTTVNGFAGYYYVLVMPVDKIYFNINQNMNYVGDTLRFSTNHNDYRILQFVNVFVSKDTSILNNAYSVGMDINNNSNWNTTNIINNDNQNTQSIINNNTSNTQNIINNENSNQAQTHQDMQDINNSLNNEDAPSSTDVSGKASEWASKNLSDGVVSNMVLMPITLLNAFVTGFSTTCSPYNLGSLYGTNLTLPCINISNYVGSNLWGVIDVLFSGLMIYAIGKKFVKIFNDFTNLRDNQVDELYGGGK